MPIEPLQSAVPSRERCLEHPKVTSGRPQTPQAIKAHPMPSAQHSSRHSVPMMHGHIKCRAHRGARCAGRLCMCVLFTGAGMRARRIRAHPTGFAVRLATAMAACTCTRPGPPPCSLAMHGQLAAAQLAGAARLSSLARAHYPPAHYLLATGH